jgi:hypothetical protein
MHVPEGADDAAFKPKARPWTLDQDAWGLIEIAGPAYRRRDTQHKGICRRHRHLIL